MSDPSKVVARRSVQGAEVVVEYQRDSGRLRIVQHGRVRVEWFPPHSWFAIASASGRSSWGTVPDEYDLQLVLDNVLTDGDLVTTAGAPGARPAGA